MEELNENLTKKERREIKREEKAGELSKDRQKKVVKRILGWLVVLGLVSFGIYTLVSYEQGITEKVGEIGQVREEDWTRGNLDAPVVLVEYSDFQCPACRAYEPILEEVMSQISNDVLFIYRHFPLTQIHSNAEEAGWASEAAGKQNKFWEMHDLLFEKQPDWANVRDPKETFSGYAQELGLDLVQFERDYESNEIRDLVSNSLSEARNAGFTGTPTFILNGEKLVNPPQSPDDFINLIRESI